jgi:hypothetical protein
MAGVRMAQTTHERSVEAGSGDAASTGGPSVDSEDRFLRRLAKLIGDFPWISLSWTVAAVVFLFGGGWQAAVMLRPLLAGEQPSVKLPGRVDLPQDAFNDISGQWRYKCTRIGLVTGSYSHGGDATIDTQKTLYGLQWRLTGTRRWREIDGKRDEIAYSWSTDWAAVTDKDRIKYTYRIATDKGTVIGYADGAIVERRNGRPVRIAGNFYQLPPLDDMYGVYEFTRD